MLAVRRAERSSLLAFRGRSKSERRRTPNNVRLAYFSGGFSSPRSIPSNYVRRHSCERIGATYEPCGALEGRGEQASSFVCFVVVFVCFFKEPRLRVRFFEGGLLRRKFLRGPGFRLFLVCTINEGRESRRQRHRAHHHTRKAIATRVHRCDGVCA